jgi:hypothetical protein
LHPQKQKQTFVVHQKRTKMVMLFILNFVVCMLQILKTERDYTHKEIMLPAFTLAFLFGLWVGFNYNFELAISVFGLCFIVRFFVSSLRFVVMLLTGTEIGSQYYYRCFAVGALVEMAALFFIIKFVF